MHFTTVVEQHTSSTSSKSSHAEYPETAAMRRKRVQHAELFRELADEIAGYVEGTCQLHKVSITVLREELARAIADYTLR